MAMDVELKARTELRAAVRRLIEGRAEMGPRAKPFTSMEATSRFSGIVAAAFGDDRKRAATLIRQELEKLNQAHALWEARTELPPYRKLRDMRSGSAGQNPIFIFFSPEAHVPTGFILTPYLMRDERVPEYIARVKGAKHPDVTSAIRPEFATHAPAPASVEEPAPPAEPAVSDVEGRWEAYMASLLDVAEAQTRVIAEQGRLIMALVTRSR